MDKKIYLIANERSQHQQSHADAIEYALMNVYKLPVKRIKTHSEVPPTAKYVIHWGWKRGPHHRIQGRQVMVIERGFIDRMEYSTLSLNGLNGNANWGDVKIDKSRLKPFLKNIRKWQGDINYKSQKPVLILGQTPGDCSLRGKNLDPWYEMVAMQVKKHHNLPCIFRPHPNVMRRNSPFRLKNVKLCQEKTLEDALNKCAFAITFNSNSAIDALLNGTPCVVYDRGSMAYGICPNYLNAVKFDEPRRIEFFERLCSQQFTVSEIKQGKGLEAILTEFLKNYDWEH